MIRFVVPLDSLHGLGALVSPKRSAASPFRFGEARPLTGADIDDLKQREVLDGDGRLAERVRPACDLLASTPAFARIRYAMGVIPFDFTVFHALDASRAVGMTIRGREALIEDPAPTEEALGAIRQYTGGSALRGTNFETELGTAEAFTLAALLDLRRRAELLAILGNRESDEQPYHAEAVAGALAGAGDGAQWFQSQFRTVLPLPSLDESAVRKSLDALQASGLVAKEGSRFRLGEEAGLLAWRMPLFEGVLTLLAGREGNGERVHAAGFTVIQSGVTNLLMLDAVGDRLKLASISSVAMLDAVARFLQAEDALASLAPAAAPMEVTTMYCPGCGRSVKADDKFCRKCGRALR